MTDEITRLETDLRKAEKEYARAYAALFDARLGLARGSRTASQTTYATAQQILHAAAKARGEVPPDPPRDPFAAAVIAAGKKRRGEV